jgi:hypothetical protein
MAESIAKDFKGKTDWVYVGKAEAPKPKEKKPDTIWNEYMQHVFDVAAPIAVAEVTEASAAQGLLAGETAEQIIPKDLQRDMKDKKTFAKRWLEWEQRHSSSSHQNRLGKMLTGLTYMAGSFALDRTSDTIANALILKKDAALGKWQRLNLTDRGNKKMIEVGWDFITDTGVEKLTDWSAKKLANREDIGFVSPLSRTLGKLGSTILNVFDKIYDESNQRVPIINSFVNPGFIEGAFRFTGAVPGLGFIKDFYAWANRQVMKGEGAIPFGTDLAYNMLIAKMINKEPPKPGGTP